MGVETIPALSTGISASELDDRFDTGWEGEQHLHDNHIKNPKPLIVLLSGQLRCPGEWL